MYTLRKEGHIYIPHGYRPVIVAARLGAHTPSEAMWPEEAPLPELVAEDAAARKKRVHSPHSDSALVLLCALDA